MEVPVAETKPITAKGVRRLQYFGVCCWVSRRAPQISEEESARAVSDCRVLLLTLTLPPLSPLLLSHLQLLTITGILLATVARNALQTIINQRLYARYTIDSPSAAGFATWANSSAPNSGTVFSSFYVYHINNPYDVYTFGAKPNVTEIGPILYYYNQV